MHQFVFSDILHLITPAQNGSLPQVDDWVALPVFKFFYWKRHHLVLVGWFCVRLAPELALDFLAQPKKMEFVRFCYNAAGRLNPAFSPPTGGLSPRALPQFNTLSPLTLPAPRDSPQKCFVPLLVFFLLPPECFLLNRPVPGHPSPFFLSRDPAEFGLPVLFSRLFVRPPSQNTLVWILFFLSNRPGFLTSSPCFCNGSRGGVPANPHWVEQVCGKQ